MGRKNKNKGNKTKSNKKPNKNAQSKPQISSAKNEEASEEDSATTQDGATASMMVDEPQIVSEPPPYIPDGRQSRACYRRSLRDEFEHQQRLSGSSEASISSSAERAFVEEIENALRQGNSPEHDAGNVIPRLDLGFVNDSESEYSARTPKTQNVLLLNSADNRAQRRGRPREGLSYIEIKSQSPQKLEDQESGIGTCSNTEITHAEERNNSFHSYDVVGKVEEHVQIELSDEAGDELDDKQKGVLGPMRPTISSESMSSMVEDTQASSHYENLIDLVSRAQDIEVRQMNSSGELRNLSFSQANIHSNMFQVTAISEPNLVRCDSDDSTSLVDDSSGGDSAEQRNSSFNSSPRSFAEFGGNDIPLELIAAQGNFQSGHAMSSDILLEKLSKSNPELQTQEDFPLDSSVDNLPMDNVTFSNPGVSIFEEIRKASNEEINSEHDLSGSPPVFISKTYAEDTGNIRVLEIKEQDQFSPLNSGKCFTGRSYVSSVKEGDRVLTPESMTEYGSSPTEGSKTLSNGDSATELIGGTPSDIIDRLPQFMQSAPGLLEAQQLEKSYREFMSSSDVSESDKDRVERSSTGKFEQLSQFEYKICYDMDEKEPVHPGEVYAMGEMPNEDLDAAFVIESSNENVSESPRSVDVLKDVEAILQDREHVSMVLANMNQEIENLRMENRHLYGEMTMYRNACKQYRGKSDSMAGYIKNLRSHVKSLEIQMAEINSQRQNMKNGFTMTDHVLLLNTSSQVVPVMYDAHLQTDNASINKGVQAGESVLDSDQSRVDRSTSTADNQQDMLLPAGPSSTESILVEEGQEKVPARATAMINKILPNKMTNITGSQQTDSSQDVDHEEPESPDKWRRLAMMPISADHMVLQLQKSLATATVEFDLIETKLKKKEQELKQLTDGMDTKMDSSSDNLQKVTTECESWQMKYEGDHTEIEMLRQKVGGLKKNLMVTQMERDKLKEDVNKIITQQRDHSVTGHKSAELEETVEQLKQLETDKTGLEEEVQKYRSIHEDDLEKVTNLEKTLNDTEDRKGLLENELKLIKEEYQTLQNAVQSLENVFPIKAGYEDPADFSRVAQTKIEELKKHVFEPRTVAKPRVPDTGSVTSTTSSSGVVSLHEDIIQQSELVLHILKETGDLEDEEVKDELVDWKQVRNSIENQLAGKSEEEVTAKDSAEKSVDSRSQTEDKDYCGANDPEVKSHLEELAKAIGSDLGVKVNIVIGDKAVTTSPKEDREDKHLQDKKERRRMEIDRSNSEYEHMRKKRLSMLVQAYTGRDTEELLSSSQPKSDLPATRPYHPPDRPEQRGDRSQSIEQKATAFREELLKDMPPPYSTNTASLPKTGYFSLNGDKEEYSSPQRESVLRQSQEDLDKLLSKSKVPRVCVARKSSTGMLAASTTDSTTPYSYRLKREIYPHKKGYLPVDQFYEEKEKEHTAEEDPRDYNNDDAYYGDYNQNGYYQYPKERNGEYSMGYRKEDPYYDTSTIKDKKEALVKLRAKLLKKKRQLAKERDRRSPMEEDSYEHYDALQSYSATTTPAMSKTWSPNEWKMQEKSPDLSTIKQSIRDYTSHLRTKYSKLNLTSPEGTYSDPPKRAWEESGDALRSSSPSYLRATSDSRVQPSFAPLYRSTAQVRDGPVPSRYDSGLQQKNTLNLQDSAERTGQRDSTYGTTTRPQYSTKYSSPSDLSTWTSSYNASEDRYADTKPNYPRDSYKSESLPATSSGYLQKAEKSMQVTYEEKDKAAKSTQGKYSVKFTEMEEREPYPAKTELTDQELYHKEMQKTLENKYGGNTKTVSASNQTRSEPMNFKSQTTYPQPTYDWTGKENGYDTSDYDKPDHYLTTQEREILTKHDYHVGNGVSDSKNEEKRYDLSSETSLLQRRYKEDFSNTVPKYSSEDLDKYSDPKRADSLKESKYSLTRRSASETRYKPPREAKLYLDDTLTNYSSRYDTARPNDEETNTKDEEAPERTFFDYSKDVSVTASSHQSVNPKSEVSLQQKEDQSSSHKFRNDAEIIGGASSVKPNKEEERQVDYQSKYLRSSLSSNRDYVTMSDSLKASTAYGTSSGGSRDLLSSTRHETVDNSYTTKTDGSFQKPYGIYDKTRHLDTSSVSYPNSGTATRAVASRDASPKFEDLSSTDFKKNKYYSSVQTVSSKPPLPTKTTSHSKSSYSQNSSYKVEPEKDTAKTDTRVKTYTTTQPESCHRSSSPYVSNQTEVRSNAYTASKAESPYRSNSPYVSSLDENNTNTYTASKGESLYRSTSPYVSSSHTESRSNTATTSKAESPYRSNSPFVTNQEQQPSLTSSEIDNLKSKYDRKSSAESAVKPVLSKEYLQYMNRSSAFDTHMMEINQRKVSAGTHEDRKFSQDDACSVTSSVVSDADFVVTSTGDIVKRKSKTAKKMDKARNTELQLMSYDGPDKHEVFKSNTETKEGGHQSKEKISDYKPSSTLSLSTKYSSNGENYSQKTRDFLKEEDEKWREPKRHFGLRGDEEVSSDLLWKEPKVYTVPDSKTRGYVDTGATGLSSSQLTGSLANDDEWFRSQKSQEVSPNVVEKTETQMKTSTDQSEELSSQDQTTTTAKQPTTTTNESLEDPEKLQRRVHWERPDLTLHSSHTSEPQQQQQPKNKPSSHSFSNNRHPVSKTDKKTSAIKMSPREEIKTALSGKAPDQDKGNNTYKTRDQQIKPRVRLTDHSIPIANIVVFPKINEALSPVAVTCETVVTSDYDKQPVSSSASQERHKHKGVLDQESKTLVDIPSHTTASSSIAKKSYGDKSGETSWLEKTTTNDVKSGADDATKEEAGQSEELPKDPYERQQLITDIIDRYTKDMDQSYLAQRDQKKKSRPGVKKRNTSKSRSSQEGSPSRGDNTSGYSSHETAEDEPIFPLKATTSIIRKSYVSSISRSPSQSPAHSRTSSVEGEFQSRIPISRSLSRERDEVLGRSPTHSRRSSEESDHRNKSQIPVKMKSLGGVFETGDWKEQKVDELRNKEKELTILEDKTRDEIDKIMRKYNMYNEDWERPQDDKVMKDLLA